MKCPICGNEMIQGKIYSFRYDMKWKPDDKRTIPGFGTLLDNHIPLGTVNLLGSGKVPANYCEHCRKIIIDV